MNSVMSINSVSFMPAFGIASAGAILVGQAIGAGKKDEVPNVVRLTAMSALVWQCSVGLVCAIIPAWLMSFFAKGEGALEVATIGARMLMISCAWQAFDAIANTVAESLRGAGDTLFPMAARVAIAWLVFVPGSYVTVRYFGGTDIAATLWLVAYLAMLAAALFLRFQAGSWRRIELVEQSLPV